MRASTYCLCVSLLAALAGCGESAASDLTIERLPDVDPSLPGVPELPPPRYPDQLGDGSYTVSGLRRRAGSTISTEVTVTGYIVEIYAAPECEEGHTCPQPAAPHLWLSDTRTPADAQDERMMLAGYAERQEQIDTAREDAARGRYEPPDPESGILPIPVDFDVGAKVRVTAQFTRMSSAGFNVSNGMLDYRRHELLEPPPGTEED